jgi:hypothetical protein
MQNFPSADLWVAQERRSSARFASG